jgi:hypothetical protein
MLLASGLLLRAAGAARAAIALRPPFPGPGPGKKGTEDKLPPYHGATRPGLLADLQG